MAGKTTSVMKIRDLQQAEGAMAEYARLALTLKSLEVKESEAIIAIKARGEEERLPVQNRLAELEAGLKTFATMNRAAVFGDKQSVELTFGALEFRKSTKTVQIAGVSPADTLEKVKMLGFLEAVSIREKLNVEAMENWTDEKLALIGRRRVQRESFRVNPHEDISA